MGVMGGEGEGGGGEKKFAEVRTLIDKPKVDRYS